MAVKDKIIHQSPTEIRLYKEGTFWVGYEQSAFLLTQIKLLKLSKRFVIAAGQEVVTVGFPDATLRNVFIQMLQVEKEEAKVVVLESVVALDRAKFEKWKAEIPLNVKKEKEDKSVTVDESNELEKIEIEKIKSSNLYSDLPVFKVAFELLEFAYSEAIHMQRAYRFTLGQRLQIKMEKLCENIYFANSEFDKTKHIARARRNTESVRLLLRLAFNKEQITLKKYVFANDKIESISKQLTRWGQYSKKVLEIDNKVVEIAKV